MNRGPSTRLYGLTVASSTASWGGGNVATRITGPLTPHYPLAMPSHSSGVLVGKATPAHFAPADLAPADRAVYRRATGTHAPSTSFYATPGSQVNYTPPVSSSMRVRNLRSIAVGKSVRHGLVSFKAYAPNDARTHLRRARSGGACAPKKKGALENRFLTLPAINAWGSLPRANY